MKLKNTVFEIDENKIPFINLSYELNNQECQGEFFIDTGSNVSIYFNKSNAIDSKELTLLVKKINLKESEEKIILYNSRAISVNNFQNERFHGILGLDVLVKKNVLLDYKRQIISTDLDLKKHNIRELSFATFIDNYLILQCEIENKTYSFLYDSGSQIDFLFFEDRMNQEHKSLIELKREKALGFNDEPHELIFYKNKISVEFSNFRHFTFDLVQMCKNKMTQNVPITISGIVNNKIFENKAIIVDYENNLLYEELI